MAIQHNEPQERISLEEFFALVESDPEHRHELIDGYPSMMTGESPDHSIIGLNIASILRGLLRKRPCIAYNSDAKVRDRGLKADLYQNMPSVQEILFIDTQVMRVQLYRRETDYWTMRNFTQHDTIELTSLGVHFSVAEVYEKTTFDDSFTEEA